MDEVIIEKQEYLLFDKYKLNTNRNITRYEYISNVPLKVTTTIIATITSKIKGSQPTHVYLESGILDKDSIVCLEQLKTIDKQRLGRFICNVGDSIMERVNGAIQISLGINNNIDKGVGNERPKII